MRRQLPERGHDRSTGRSPGGSRRSGVGRRFAVLAALSALALLPACGGASSEPSSETRTAAPGAAPSAATSSSATATPSSVAPATPPATSATPSASRAAAPVGTPKATDVVIGLDAPWGLVALPDGSVLVSERDTAAIVRVQDGKTSKLRELPEVRPGGEGGLLGLAISPDRRTVFAYYTAASDNRIVAMSWDGSQLGAPRVIFDGIPKGSRHDGGRLVIGPDGYLYVGTGETGDEPLAQDKKSLAGKILRLRLDGRPAPGNPFDSAVYSYGHRNVQGLAFDAQGRLWASEFGNQTWDELNLITKGGNYGWPTVEGSGDKEGLINPKLVWSTSEASPSGLAFWRGELWMAALRGERLWRIPLDGTSVGDPQAYFANRYGRLRSVTVTADGRSLLLTASNTDGRADPRKGDDRVLRVTD